MVVTHWKGRVDKSGKGVKKIHSRMSAMFWLLCTYVKFLMLMLSFSIAHSFQVQARCFEGHFVMILSRFRLFAIQRESMHSLTGKYKTYLSTNQKNDYSLHVLYPLPNPRGSSCLFRCFFLLLSLVGLGVNSAMNKNG